MNKLFDIDHIYIIHYPPAVNRRAYLDAWLQQQNFPQGYVEFWTKYRYEELDPKEVATNYIADPIEQRRQSYEIKPAYGVDRSLRFPSTPQEIAITMQHISIYKDCISKGYKKILILEDDVIFGPNFVERFNKYLPQCPQDAEVVSIGNGLDMHINELPYDVRLEVGKHFYENPLHHMRCADSYTITNNACEQILSDIIPFVLIGDWLITRQLQRHNLKLYWMEPNLITQGSQNEMYQSLLR